MTTWNENSIDQIKQLLIKIGMSPLLRGYKHLSSCVYLCVLDADNVHHLMTRVYGEVARHSDTTATCVERNIRHAIRVFANHNHVTEFNKLLKATLYTKNDYPTNGELIAYLAEYIRMNPDFDIR